MAPEFDHLGEALDEATVPIVAELRERLEITPSEKDWLAIDTALAKAALIGVRRGARELSEQVDEAIPDDARGDLRAGARLRGPLGRALRAAALAGAPCRRAGARGLSTPPRTGRSAGWRSISNQIRLGFSPSGVQLPAVGELVQQQLGVFGVVGVPADRHVDLVERPDQLDAHDVLGHPDPHLDRAAGRPFDRLRDDLAAEQHHDVAEIRRGVIDLRDRRGAPSAACAGRAASRSQDPAVGVARHRFLECPI